MASKRKNIFLYLTMACFLGVIAIFTFDGYIGVYDTFIIKSGEEEQKIEADHWLRDDMHWSTVTSWGDKTFFTYEIANRNFSRFEADVEVTLWQSQEKVQDLVSEHVSISSFDKKQLDWTLDTTMLVAEDEALERSVQFTVIIKRGDLERRVIWHVNPVPYPAKPVPTRP